MPENDMTPYFDDGQVTLWHGDALEVLRALPAASVDCCVTSPPYYGLRDYGEPGQYGAESTPGEYVGTMRQVFAEVRRVLADDGTLWLNLGDSYSANGKPGPPKTLLGIPWRVALAVQSDGWKLRNSIVWHKPNAMPESVTDRLSGRHELLFLLSKSSRYWFDLGPIRESHSENKPWGKQTGAKPGQAIGALRGHPPEWHQTGLLTRRENPGGRNPGDVWTIPTQPFPDSHFAVMAPEIARRCILAGCKPGGVTLDPFCGTGTTGMVAQQHGRRFVGIDLSRDYLDLALRTRLAQTAILDSAQ